MRPEHDNNNASRNTGGAPDIPKTTKLPDWYATWFESPWYMRLYRHRTDDEAVEATELVTKHAGIAKGSHVLDLCCGYGRHALALAQLGYDVVGIDQSRYLIDRAREVYPHERVRYEVADMRGPFSSAPYDAIVNFFTSFGYFETHAENMRVLHAVHDALRDGGVFIMDFFNAQLVRSDLVAESVSMIDDVTIIQERAIVEPFVTKTITVSDPCSYETEFRERVWLYDSAELVTMFAEAGLVVEQTLGNYDGSPFVAEESPRTIIIARRSP